MRNLPDCRRAQDTRRAPDCRGAQDLHGPIKTALGSIHAEPELIQHTQEALRRKLYAEPSVSETVISFPDRPSSKAEPSPGESALSRRVRRLAACAACFLLLLLGGSYLYLTPTAFISIDINPSLEMGINRFDRVVSVKGYNPEGQALAGALNVRFRNYKDALEQLLEDPELAALQAEGQDLSLTVAGYSGKQSSRILQHVEACTAGQENVHCQAGNSEHMEEAHSEGLSFGKYQAYLTLRELDPSITPEDVRHLSMAEIRERIQAYSESAPEDAGETPADPENASGGSGETQDSHDTQDSVETQGSHETTGRHHGEEPGHHGHLGED